MKEAEAKMAVDNLKTAKDSSKVGSIRVTFM